MLTIHGYLQNQLNSYGLKVGVIHTRTSNVDISNVRTSFGKYICYGAEAIDTSNNKKITNRNIDGSRLFYKYFVYHGTDQYGNITSIIFDDADSGKPVKTINVSSYPAIISTPDHLYISYSSGRYNDTYLNTSLTVIIVDKKLSTKTVTYNGACHVPSTSTEVKQYVNLGDEGVVVGMDSYNLSNGYNFIIYKNGSFVKKTCAFTDLKYYKNGHSYNFGDIGELVTDSISLIPGTGYLYANNTTNIVVCVLHNLANNTTSKILVPIDCFNIDTGNALSSTIVVTEKYHTLSFYTYNKMNNNDMWLIRVYKE